MFEVAVLCFIILLLILIGAFISWLLKLLGYADVQIMIIMVSTIVPLAKALLEI